MSRYLFALASLIGMLSAAFVCETARAQDAATEAVSEVPHAPRIASDEPEFEFGDRPSGESVEHTFTIRNDGDLTLVINRVRASCGCTAASPSRNEIPPGETAEISARFSLAGRSGRQHSSITVESNDPNNPRFMLALKGTAVTEITLNPRQVYMGQVGSDAVVTQSVEVTLNSSVEVVGVESTSEAFAATLETLEPGRHLMVHVVTRPPLASGSLSGEIRLNRADGSVISIPAAVTVIGALTYAPQELLLRESEPRSTTRHIIVRPGQVQSFELLHVDVPDPAILVSTTSLGSNGYRIQLDNIPISPELNGKKVILQTNLGQMPAIEIPFRVTP